MLFRRFELLRILFSRVRRYYNIPNNFSVKFFARFGVDKPITPQIKSQYVCGITSVEKFLIEGSNFLAGNKNYRQNRILDLKILKNHLDDVLDLIGLKRNLFLKVCYDDFHP